MKHKRMLISAIILIAIGFILMTVLSPITMYFGIGSYTTSSWFGLFSETHYYYGYWYWIGLILGISGLILTIIGLILIPIFAILEYADKKGEA